MPTANMFRTLFGWMMGFVALTWMWSVALIMGWPWDRNVPWEATFPLVATCQNNEACSVFHGKLAEAKEKGIYVALAPPEPFGEVQEADAWVKWRTEQGKPWQYEVSRSSWDFETTVRYKFEGETPVLLEVKRYDVRILLYAMPLALLMVGGMYLRSLRN